MHRTLEWELDVLLHLVPARAIDPRGAPMDAGRFDALARTFALRSARRQILRGLAGTTLGLALLESRSGPIQAKKKKRCGPCKKRKKGKCKPKPNGTPCPDFGTCQRGRCVLPFCSGKNFCVDTDTSACGLPNCNCFVTKATGAPFCASTVRKDPCTTCGPGETCVATPLCGVPEGCASPCANPL